MEICLFLGWLVILAAALCFLLVTWGMCFDLVNEKPGWSLAWSIGFSLLFW